MLKRIVRILMMVGLVAILAGAVVFQIWPYNVNLQPPLAAAGQFLDQADLRCGHTGLEMGWSYNQTSYGLLGVWAYDDGKAQDQFHITDLFRLPYVMNNSTYGMQSVDILLPWWLLLLLWGGATALIWRLQFDPPMLKRSVRTCTTMSVIFVAGNFIVCQFQAWSINAGQAYVVWNRTNVEIIWDGNSSDNIFPPWSFSRQLPNASSIFDYARWPQAIHLPIHSWIIGLPWWCLLLAVGGVTALAWRLSRRSTVGGAFPVETSNPAA